MSGCRSILWLAIIATTALPARTRAEERKPTMVRAMGYHRTADSGICIWRGNERKLRTMTHELLHRATNEVPRAARAELARLTSDRAINEGLTSYFTNRALARTGRCEVYGNPAPDASFRELRAWARNLRSEAHDAIRDAFGVEVSTKKIAILSDKSFARVYARDFGKPWVSHPGQPGVYGDSRQRVEELVALAGERAVERAYFQGDLSELRAQLRRQPRSARPGWLALD
jgi:hypothetical protein